MLKITAYRQVFNRRLDREWEWYCPLWINDIFSKVQLKCVGSFKTKKDAIDNMRKVLKCLEIAKTAKKVK